MKSWIKKTALGLVAALSFFGVNVGSTNASLQSDTVKIKENTPLYLEHASNILTHAQERNNFLADHESHYSHDSHSSHSSHDSHYSHYSSRD